MAAVQIFNSPLITFKSEIFIVLIIIAWTYLLHAYFRKQGIEYRYYKIHSTRRTFYKTRYGAYKYWELGRCLSDSDSPVDKNTANNLRFLIGIRNEIEHQMTYQIDPSLSAKFQAACLNFNEYIKTLFGKRYGIDKHLAFSLQFTSISQDQFSALPTPTEMPSHIRSFIEGFEGELSEEEYNSPHFAYRVLFIAKTANTKGQADKVIEFVKADSPLATNINKTYAVIKETEKPKYLPSAVVEIMQSKGFSKFKMLDHIKLWQQRDAKEPSKHFGTLVQNTWYWYDKWVNEVEKYCQQEYGNL